jgi:hypothetical protein
MPAEAAPVALRCVAGTDTDLRLVECDAGLPGHVRHAGERRAQVAFHIHGQGFEGADVNHAAAFTLPGLAVQHQPIQAPEKCGQGLARAGGSKNQGVVAARDCRPSEPLRGGGPLEDGAKPGCRERMKEVQDIL